MIHYRAVLIGIVLAQVQLGGPFNPNALTAPRQIPTMPGMANPRMIVPQMGNSYPLGSAGNPVVAGPPRPWGSAVPTQPFHMNRFGESDD